MIKRYFARRHHKQALKLFRRCYQSLGWARMAMGTTAARQNIKGRHAAYREVAAMWYPSRPVATTKTVSVTKANAAIAEARRRKV